MHGRDSKHFLGCKELICHIWRSYIWKAKSIVIENILTSYFNVGALFHMQILASIELVRVLKGFCLNFIGCHHSTIQIIISNVGHWRGSHDCTH